MVVIKTITQPQDIYIIGADYKGKEETFAITDDYHMLCVVNGKAKKYMDTDGYVFILTKEQLLEWSDLMWEDPSEMDGQEGLVLHNFSGDIRLRVVTEKGRDLLHKFDNQNYVMHQIDDESGEDVDDIILDIDPHYNIDIETIAEIYEREERLRAA